MNDTDKVEPHIQKRAASIVDMLFENKLFIEDITRVQLQAVEDYLAFEIDSGIKNGIRVKEILKKAGK